MLPFVVIQGNVWYYETNAQHGFQLTILSTEMTRIGSESNVLEIYKRRKKSFISSVGLYTTALLPI